MCFADDLKFRNVIIEDDEFHIWCSSPIRGNDGLIHVFASRIPIEEDPATNFGFDHWYATSEIAHYRANSPEGPYTFIRTLLKPGVAPEGTWNSGAQHNPAVTKVGDEFVLLYHSNTCTIGHNDPGSYRIGMLTTKDINGTWHDQGMLLAGPSPETLVSWGYAPERRFRGVDNPALLAHPNGNFYLYFRARWLRTSGNNTYGVAVSSSLTGPYNLRPHRVVDNPRYIEDPFVYMEGDTVKLLVTDNHLNKGLLLSSKDPLRFSFDIAEEGFHVMERYIPDNLLRAARNYRHPKFERPQLLLENGRPTHLFAPGGCNIHRGPGTCCYLLKVE